MTEQTPEPTLSDLMTELRRLADGHRESAILTPEELHAVTGYKIASRQLEVLHRLGFIRARIGMGGRVILERYHYQMVCAGQYQREMPNLRPFDPLRPRGGMDLSKIK